MFLETNATTVKINEVEYDLWGTSAGVTSGRSYNGEFLHNNNHYSANSYVIPSSITYEGNAYIVDKITDHCFYDGYASPTYSKSIKKITLPNTIKYIGDKAFRSHRPLHRVRLHRKLQAAPHPQARLPQWHWR